MTKRKSGRFVVGIDLGTTQSAMAAVDTTAESPTIAIVPVPQRITPTELAARPTLPSFLYLAGPNDPVREDTAGEWARTRGAEVPARLVSSAKSWLCHPGVDRKGAILPWGAGDDVARLSPVEASARYLRHMASAWDQAHPDAPLAEQEVLLTVPASFDAVARDLTMEAARDAGLAHVTLLEEPQAAFYSWLAHAGDAWRKRLTVGDVVLVCDIGGGTTDFSLIAVAEKDGDLALERVAVGDHILLGGDNMDLALSYHVAQKLGQKLDTWQQRALVHACRTAKEQLLTDSGRDRAQVAILGRSSKLIGGTIKVDVERADVVASLVDGFFPRCGVGDRPARNRRVGFQELGLPYAADAAVTRHLAEFLGRHGRMPTAVLYNGGVMKGTVLREQLGRVLAEWAGQPLKELDGSDLDLAVAHGAAAYGMVRRGRGIRIRGGAARAYYVGVETAMPAVPGMPPPLKALCVVPFGMEEGTEATLPGPPFGLVVGEPAEFRFLASSIRREDHLGTVVEEWPETEIEELAPLEVVLAGDDAGATVPVELHSKLTEVGTLELWCVAKEGGRRWKLEYGTRGDH